MIKLDLHGIRHEDVKRKVIKFIEDNWMSGKLVRIITGHSNKMKKLVGEILDEYDLDWQIGNGVNPIDITFIQTTLP